VAALEQRLGLVEPAGADVEVGEPVAHRADPRGTVRDLAERAGVRRDEVLVGAHRAVELGLAERDHQLDERRVEHVAIDRARQHADHLVERELVALVRRCRQRGALDRADRAGEPRPRAGQPGLAHDLRHPLGARDVLGHPDPVEQRRLRRLRRRHEVRVEVILVARTTRGQRLPGGHDLLGRQPADPHGSILPSRPEQPNRAVPPPVISWEPASSSEACRSASCSAPRSPAFRRAIRPRPRPASGRSRPCPC